MQMSDWKIGTRLGLAFGLLIVMMLGVVVIGLVRFGTVGTVNSRIIEEDWVKAEAANMIDTTTRANARRTMELVLATDAQHLQAIKAAIATNKKTIDEAVATLDKLVHLPEGKALLAQLKEKRGQYVQSFTRVIGLVDGGARDDAIALIKSETLPALDALQEPINGLTALQKRIVANSSTEVLGDIRNSSWVMLALALGLSGLALGSVLAYWITRSITVPLRRAVQVAQTVAAGDLGSHIAVAGRDETSELLQALRDMNHNLQNIVSQVRSGTDTIATATSQIAAGNQDLSSRTEEQASALEQTAASMQELAGTVKHNFDSGKHANELAESAAQVAAKGAPWWRRWWTPWRPSTPRRARSPTSLA